MFFEMENAELTKIGPNFTGYGLSSKFSGFINREN